MSSKRKEKPPRRKCPAGRSHCGRASAVASWFGEGEGGRASAADFSKARKGLQATKTKKRARAGRGIKTCGVAFLASEGYPWVCLWFFLDSPKCLPSRYVKVLSGVFRRPFASLEFWTFVA